MIGIAKFRSKIAAVISYGSLWIGRNMTAFRNRIRGGSVLYWIIGSIAAIFVVLAPSIFFAKQFAEKSEDVPAWVQAFGAVVTIVSGAAFALWQQAHAANQKSLDAIAAAEAAYRLSFEAFGTIGARLNVALSPVKHASEYNLGGLRTTEMVEAMREVDTSRVPTPLLADFIKLRSQIYAINARISELYVLEDVADDLIVQYARSRRREELASAVRTYRDAEKVLKSLQNQAGEIFGILVKDPVKPAQITAYNLINDLG